MNKSYGWIDDAKEDAIAKCTSEIQLTPQQLRDVKLICNGGQAEATYNNVVEKWNYPTGSSLTILLKDIHR